MEAIELPEIIPTETEVFTPDELREMLMAARGELIPWLAIAAFCGLRTAEILRLEWKDVHLEEGFVEGHHFTSDDFEAFLSETGQDFTGQIFTHTIRFKNN